MDVVDNRYIENALTALMKSFGAKECVDSDAIVSLIRAHKIKEAIKAIAQYLGLPIEIDLSFISDRYSADAGPAFDSRHVVKTDWRGRGTESITAQVSIPSSLPLYGSQGLVNYPIKVRVRQNCAEHPSTLITVMAHELSHILLHSIRHPQKENEFYTDLTAMIFGFSDVMRSGRKIVTRTSNGSMTTTRTTTYGYLSDSNFEFAYAKVQDALDEGRLARQRAKHKLDVLEADVNQKRAVIRFFNDYLAALDKSMGRTKRIPQHDAEWIASFHRPDYMSDFVSATDRAIAGIRQFRSFLQELDHYDESRLAALRRHEEKLREIEIDKKYDRVNGAVTIMKRYVPMLQKLRIYWKSR